MKKILVVTGFSGAGGTETVSETVFSHFNDIGIDTKLFNLVRGNKINNFDWFTHMFIKYGVKTKFKSNYKILGKIQLLIQFMFSSADLVFIYEPKVLKNAYFIKKLFFKKYKIISWLHCNVDFYPSNSLRCLEYADTHLVISTETKSKLINMGINPLKINLIFNPISETEVCINKSSDEVTKFIFIGRIDNKSKNIKGILDTLNSLNYEKKIQFDIYGDGIDRNQLYEYSKHIMLKNKYLKIYWHGWKADPWAEILEADALILNSNYEGFGMVLLEAINRGSPVISSNCESGPIDIVQPNRNGFLVEVNDYESFSNILRLFISKSINFERKDVKETAKKFNTDEYLKKFDEALNINTSGE